MVYRLNGDGVDGVLFVNTPVVAFDVEPPATEPRFSFCPAVYSGKCEFCLGMLSFYLLILRLLSFGSIKLFSGSDCPSKVFRNGCFGFFS